MDTVVNIDTLKPALVYPFVTGLKFIPLLFLLVAYWVPLGLRGNGSFLGKPSWGTAYIVLGMVSLCMTCTALVQIDYGIWRARLTSRTFIFGCYMIVFAINLAIWLLGYSFWRGGRVFVRFRNDLTGLVSFCGLAYLVVAFLGVLIEQEHNAINRHYLDKRRPEAYVVTNPYAVRDFRKLQDSRLRTHVGPDLASLLDDPEFVEALKSKKFYKQNFDEPFQVLNKAVMFGYMIENLSEDKPIFLIIRFPKELADALRFQFVGEKN